jgi:hypothetical protein
MAVPAGGQLSIALTFDGKSGHTITDIFDVGGIYKAAIIPVSGADVLFSIRCTS